VWSTLTVGPPTENGQVVWTDNGQSLVFFRLDSNGVDHHNEFNALTNGDTVILLGGTTPDVMTGVLVTPPVQDISTWTLNLAETINWRGYPDGVAVDVSVQRLPPGPQGPIGATGPPGANGTVVLTGAAGQWTAMTQAEYDAIDTPDPNVLYVIVGSA